MPTGLGRSLVEVQRCPLGSEGPWLRPTALGTLRLRSRRAHSDRQPAVEAQQWEKLEDEEREEEEEENNCGKI